MADAPSHDKEVEDLVRPKGTVSGIEDGKLQGIDDSAYCVDDAAG